MADIFDLTNLDDLSATCKKKLLSKKAYDYTLVYELFKIKETLNVNEIIVGLYRKFNLEKNAMQIRSLITVLIRHKLVIKVNGSVNVFQKAKCSTEK